MQDFTIIIPTHNRPGYLRRILDYYGGYKAGYNIIVADSSSDENKRKNRETVSSAQGLKILYLGEYPSGINSWHKFADALSHAGTEYCLFCADDDFVIPNEIERSMDFLQKNGDFVVAHGQTVVFFPKIKEKGERKFYWQLEYPFRPNVFDDAKSRLDEHLANYSVPTFYCVHRTDFFKAIFKEALNYAVHPRFIELLLTELTLVSGKMECSDRIYAAREVIFDSAGIVSEEINDLIAKGAYEEHYAGFRKCLTLHLNKNSGLSMEESGRAVDNAMSAHLDKFRPGPRKKFLLGLLDRLPKPVSGKIKSEYRTMKLRLSRQGGEILRLAEDPLSEYHADFVRIRDCVVSHGEIYKK